MVTTESTRNRPTLRDRVRAGKSISNDCWWLDTYFSSDSPEHSNFLLRLCFTDLENQVRWLDITSDARNANSLMHYLSRLQGKILAIMFFHDTSCSLDREVLNVAGTLLWMSHFYAKISITEISIRKTDVVLPCKVKLRKRRAFAASIGDSERCEIQCDCHPKAKENTSVWDSMIAICRSSLRAQLVCFAQVNYQKKFIYFSNHPPAIF